MKNDTPTLTVPIKILIYVSAFYLVFFKKNIETYFNYLKKTTAHFSMQLELLIIFIGFKSLYLYNFFI